MSSTKPEVIKAPFATPEQVRKAHKISKHRAKQLERMISRPSLAKKCRERMSEFEKEYPW